MTGIVSGVEGIHTLIGDASLSKRPMDRVAEPLEMMGSKFSGQGKHITPPLKITGSTSLVGIEYHVPKARAQVKSAIIFAGLSASGPSTVHEDVRTRSATEDMLRHAGIQIESVDVGQGRSVTVHPGRPKSAHWVVPGDPSQAAFFAVLGLVHPNAQIHVNSIDTSAERIGFVSVLQRMGASLSIDASGIKASSSKLTATEIHASEIPSVDEVPALSVAAAAATGVTSFLDMGELRLKESDRFEGSLRIASLLGCIPMLICICAW
jgi:3-phosphoshikimate 1-carboxyvinyltransferase